MTEVKEDLIKCSGCKCLKMKSLFKTNKNTGKLLKTCITCREKFKCSYENCEYKGGYKCDLQQHTKQVHDKIKNFSCDKCEYRCCRNSHLQDHINQVHCHITNFKCDDCEYQCYSNSVLQKHINRVHRHIINFKCDDCEYQCYDNSNLQQHINRVHLHIKNFSCSDCDYKCYDNAHLQRHINQAHLHIKNFSCSDCDYECYDNAHLQRHILICTGSRNISGGEFQVIKSLEELGLIEDEDYVFNSTFSELTDYSKKNLRFDFRLLNHKIVIEYDGQQHFKPIAFGSENEEETQLNFEKTKEYDKLKDDFCKEYGYKMIRIPYTQFPNILSILHTELIDIIDNIG